VGKTQQGTKLTTSTVVGEIFPTYYLARTVNCELSTLLGLSTIASIDVE
jgi:hypothetical protein